MPTIDLHQSSKTTKLLNVGPPGGGKTGATACLAKAGYRLIVVDFDNGADILRTLLASDKEASQRVYCETFTDKLKAMRGMAHSGGENPKDFTTTKIVTAGSPTAFNNALNALTRWRFPTAPGSSETYDLGNIGDWGPDTVVVIDSLGLAGNAALRFVRQLNQHQFDEFTSQPDYGQAMDRIEGMLQLLYSDAVSCHVIVNTHVTYLENQLTGGTIGLPRALGSKLPPKVGGYFNTIVCTMPYGVGKQEKRMICTSAEGSVALKLPVLPGTVPNRLPIETGLLTIFKALQSHDWIDPAQSAKT